MSGDKVAPGTDQLGGGATLTAEVKPLNPVKSWWTRIDEAEARGGFLDGEMGMSWSWLDCACGEQDPRIPRYPNGQPVDWKLMDYGACFGGAVNRNDFGRARDLLRAIEVRASEILCKLSTGAAAGTSANQEAPAAPLTLNADEHSEERCTCGQLTPWNCEGDCGGGK